MQTVIFVLFHPAPYSPSQISVWDEACNHHLLSATTNWTCDLVPSSKHLMNCCFVLPSMNNIFTCASFFSCLFQCFISSHTFVGLREPQKFFLEFSFTCLSNYSLISSWISAKLGSALPPCSYALPVILFSA